MPPPTWRTRRASSSAPASSRPVIPRSWTSRRRRSPSSACPSRPRWRATPSWRRRRDGGEDTRARRRPGRRARGGRVAGRGRGARGVGPRARPGRAASGRPGAGGLRGGGGGATARGAPNVVLIMVDTLRADHLSCYGSTAVKTPHIDALAADGTRWANAFAQASWTRPSVATILTGLYPSSHGAVHKADRLPERVDTLAERLRGIGYRTARLPDNAKL